MIRQETKIVRGIGIGLEEVNLSLLTDNIIVHLNNASTFKRLLEIHMFYMAAR